MGWNDREIHAKEDEDYFNESDDEEEAIQQASRNYHPEVTVKERGELSTPFSTPSISHLKLESNNVSRSHSEEKIDDKLLSKKTHGLDKIALYEDNYENVDCVVVGGSKNNFN